MSLNHLKMNGAVMRKGRGNKDVQNQIKLIIS
jgi:hypothetical protein